jgi:hypothetical protein
MFAARGAGNDGESGSLTVFGLVFEKLTGGAGIGIGLNAEASLLKKPRDCEEWSAAVELSEARVFSSRTSAPPQLVVPEADATGAITVIRESKQAIKTRTLAGVVRGVSRFITFSCLVVALRPPKCALAAKGN